MSTATCTSTNIEVFRLFEEYEMTKISENIISVMSDTDVEWFIPLYDEDTYEVTDANGNKAVFVID
ncbi:hypothetical protein ACQ31_gp097 [Salmonella phage STML-198]|uniref:Uncharacterized protein n=3 Tax=Gelderlandvirus TaxID=1913653 RepID=K4I5Z1_9CAUD|nr:hypothetical protein STP4a_028 [Salmonella phage STP4-a]YP_009148022.1 hypothetical protein ACQ31_gp097 [Salmonella phage STML-198]YP_009615513.1 hypothetical protein FDI73_gp027 [Salmonella phage Melville]UFK27156.1 hypothetical protein LG358_00135 [Escherichia phage UoN_LG358_1]WKV23377.1 hypothetical protein SEA1_gp0029 [Salmonella phage SEA1]AFU63980.1 hypothetical protein [Salmonella phage STML-198]AHJ86884.1 hypothetical protein STP4a_028 [Salmonella phage STP4-a]ATN93001.1 hypothet